MEDLVRDTDVGRVPQFLVKKLYEPAHGHLVILARP